MLTKIDFYTVKLIKENFLYLAILILSIFLIFVFIPFKIKKINSFQEKIVLLNQEINDLKTKINLISALGQNDLNRSINVLDELLPSNEDYFSMITSLEALSNQTNFIITSYSISFNDKNQNKIALKVEGEGNLEAFIKFLESYRFKGGRLITMDNVDFSSETFKHSLTLYFHTAKVKELRESKKLIIDQKTMDMIKKITQEQNLMTIPNQTTNEEKFPPQEYPIKNNPFSLPKEILTEETQPSE